MREYKIEIVLKLDDEGFLMESNWIESAIQEQLQANEEIIYCNLKELTRED